MSTSPDSLRARKEQFVSGHSGTSHWEVLMITLVMPLFALPGCLIARKIGNGIASASIEFILTILPTLALTTQILTVDIWMMAAFACFSCAAALQLKNLTKSKCMEILRDFAQQRRRYIDTHRGVMLATTCLAILAVDFRVFPRRFAKAETFGTGLMDSGPGIFVFASGMVAKPTSRQSSPYRVLRGAAPLIVIGCARLVSVAAADYQVHVGEYGVHWNFFFTLAGVAVFSSLLPVKGFGVGFAGIGISILHQLILSQGNMSEYINSQTRGDSLVDLNKEGLFSLPGYLAIHLWGVAFGQLLLWAAKTMCQSINAVKKSDPTSKMSPFAGLGKVVALFFALTVSFHALFFLSQNLVQPVSRRSCNLTYIVWIAAVSSCSCFVNLLGDVFGSRPMILHLMSRNLLAVFLAANLGTGFVNMTVNTMEVPDSAARMILGVYMALVCAIGVFAGRLTSKS